MTRKISYFLLITLILPFAVHAQTVERIWADHETGTERFGQQYRHAVGYNFTPLVNGKIVGLGGNFDGNYQVKLFNRETGELLAETYVNSNNQWRYAEIAPVDVAAETQYTVAAYIYGRGSKIANRQARFPLEHGNVRIDGRTYVRISNDYEVRPTINSLFNIVHGRADALFEANEAQPIDYENRFKLKAAFDFTLYLSCQIGDDITWYIESDGQRVLQRNAAGELKYKYFRNFAGAKIRAWLIEFIDGEYRRVSNVIEYQPGLTDTREIELGSGYLVSRLGSASLTATWVVEENGSVVHEQNAFDESTFVYTGNDLGSSYRVWLKDLVGNEYQVVSNTVEYQVGQTEFEVQVDQQFNLFRDGQLGDQATWVIEKDGAIVLERSADSELDYTYFDNAPGSKFRVWLKMFVNGQYQVVSNVVEYEVPASYDYTLTIAPDFTVTRSGALGDRLTWVVIKNGQEVLGRNASNELSYRYFSNTPGSEISIHLEQFRDGLYVPVSNTVTYRP